MDGTGSPQPEHTNGRRRRGVRHPWLALAGVILLLAVAAQYVTGDDGDDEATIGATRASGTALVTYHVTGTASSVDITVSSPTGTQQASGRDVPLGTADDPGGGLTMAFDRGDFVYIAAQNTNSFGYVECRIEASDGTTISENRSDGAYAIATCEGTAS